MSSSPPSHSGGRRRSRRRRRAPPPPPPPHDLQQEASSSRIAVEVWPEPFVEALALQVAMDASSTIGRLASAPALALLFQVCSTWRAVSRSEYLWQSLTRRIWNRTHLSHATWRDEYISRHSIAANFRLRRYAHTTLQFADAEPAALADEEAGANANLICLRLALSDHHLAAGFSDGSLRVFDLETSIHLHTFHPLPRDRLGLFSRAVTGIVLPGDGAPRAVFSSLDGDIHISVINGGHMPTRRAQLGDVVNDGTLIDFAGCNRFWVGLYAGVPGRAIHIWDAESEQLLFVGGTLTDPEALTGWHLLTELTSESIGRVRIAGHEIAVACTGIRSLVFDLRHPGLVLGEDDPRRGIVVGSMDADPSEEAYVSVNRRGIASVRTARSMEELRRFPLRGGAQVTGLLGAMNLGYVLICAAGTIRVWDAERGDYLYSIRERVGDATYVTASDRHVSASETDTTIHLWDFGGA